jgi:hypothetical protein
MLSWLHEEARAAGREASALGVEGGLGISGVSEDGWLRRAEAWRDFGATDLLVDTGELRGRPAASTLEQEIGLLRRVSLALAAVRD